MKTLVLGATGYTGMLLIRILSAHPHVRSVTAASSTRDGVPITEIDHGIAPHLLEKIEPRYCSIAEAQNTRFDVVFSALPHGASAEIWAPFIGRAVIIDLSADFRYSDPDAYLRAYGSPPPLPEHRNEGVYGLVEWYRDAIPAHDIIANPGCYPTATLLPILPIVSDDLVRGTIITNALSGISGAGKKAGIKLIFAERNENVNAYNPGTGHRHASEIQEQIALNAPAATDGILFTPHLVPVKQGMITTSVIPVHDTERAAAAIVNRYRDEPFVRLTGDRPPESRHVRGTNRIDIGIHVESGHLIVMAAIDNLWKGASGQAVQNMNVRFGVDETAGLLYAGDL